jgi:biofilm PGA synthesis N-glycosyltransferase PgaC
MTILSFAGNMILPFIALILFLAYSILVLHYWLAWKRIPVFYASGKKLQTPVSVIIPARNEEAGIGILLKALQQQTYPAELFEVIVVDDHSTDKTAEIVKSFPQYKLIHLPDDNINSYKKKALETGIAAATGNLIVTTDADCIPPPGWLMTIAAFKEEKKAVFMAAPVSINCSSSMVQVFQAMDFMMLQGITGAVVHTKQMSMCNGANLAYEKKVFYEVDGFSGIKHIASGDDMLLMYKIVQKYSDDVHYLKSKEAIVTTQPVKTWTGFFNQRIRWASKAAKYQDKRIFPVLLLVYLFNFSFLLLAIGIVWNPQWGYWAAGALLAKTLAELPLFISVANFFNKQWAVRWFLFFQPVHILYTIISGLLGQFGKYEWKGRKVS